MRDLLLWGVGELGRFLGGAALRANMRVTPITRATQPENAFSQLPSDTPLLIAVGEAELDAVLARVPEGRKGAVILLQNELFPAHWQAHQVQPTVLVPWLLKKRGEPELVGRATRVFGVHARLVEELHQILGIACEPLPDAQALRQALVEKYTFILTINALGLVRDLKLGEWRIQDPERVEKLARESARLGAARAESSIDEAACVASTFEAMERMASIAARGRTAGARVARALDEANKHGLVLPELMRTGEVAR
jgi:hypothetical protein